MSGICCTAYPKCVHEIEKGLGTQSMTIEVLVAERLTMVNRIAALEAELAKYKLDPVHIDSSHACVPHELEKWKACAEKMADSLKEIYLVLDGLCDTGWEPDMKKIREVVAAYDAALAESTDLKK